MQKRRKVEDDEEEELSDEGDENEGDEEQDQDTEEDTPHANTPAERRASVNDTRCLTLLLSTFPCRTEMDSCSKKPYLNDYSAHCIDIPHRSIRYSPVDIAILMRVSHIFGLH